MSRAVFLLLLLFVSAYSTKNTLTYSLTPSIPPKAFVGEYYTCDFRVQGLYNPTYKFTNLPSFLRSSLSGRIEGTPTRKGTYKIAVRYYQGRKTGQAQLILSVSDPQVVIVTSNTQKKQPQTKIVNISYQSSQKYPFIPSAYRTGDDIFLNLPQYFNLPNKVWTYQQLPEDLTGADNGCIKGSLYSEGLYSFGAIHSDQNGKTKSFIITLNIQPSYEYNYWSGTELEAVPIKDSCKCYNKAIQTQKLAISLVAQAQEAVKAAQQKVDQIKNFIGKQAVIVTLAQNTLKTQTEVKQITFAKQCELVKKEQTAKDIYNKAKGNYDLAVINYNSAQCNLDKLKEKLRQAEQNFNKTKTIFEAANKVFIDAQSASAAAATEICALQVTIAGYKDDIKSLFVAVGTAKQVLQNYQTNLTNFLFASSNAHNAKDIANMENDIALAEYRNKEDISNKTLWSLKKANQDVTDTRDDLNDAGAQLGAAKFNLTQAMNQLLVAQAAKAQADKNMAIMSSQAASPLEKVSTYIFAGCDKGLYPSFSGTIPVKDLLSNGAVLASGHTLVYGNCSKTVQVVKGDVISFEGYLKDGVIHGLLVSK